MQNESSCCYELKAADGASKQAPLDVIPSAPAKPVSDKKNAEEKSDSAKPNDEDKDYYDGMYAEDANDPFAKYYVEEESI